MFFIECTIIIGLQTTLQKSVLIGGGRRAVDLSDIGPVIDGRHLIFVVNRLHFRNRLSNFLLEYVPCAFAFKR